MKKVLVIAGPTASGKSDFAVEVAKKVGGIIISGDYHVFFQNPRFAGGRRPDPAGGCGLFEYAAVRLPAL